MTGTITAPAALDGESRRSGAIPRELAWRRDRSRKPIRVDAKIKLGSALDIDELPRMAGSLPLPRQVRDPRQAGRSWIGDRTDWRFRTTGEFLEISGAGCCNSYGILGSPGTGKTHLVRKILQNLIDFAPDRPHQQFGGLILDPKGSIADDIIEMFEDHPRAKDLVVVDGSALQTPVNIIDCRLPTRELARTLVLAAQSSGVTAKENYWFLAWTNLFAAAMTLLEYRFARELTLGRIVESVLTVHEDGLREIEVIARDMELNPAAWADVCAQYASGRSSAEIAAEIRQSAVDIKSFYRSRQDHIATVETFIINAFGEFRGKRCEVFSPEAHSWAGSATGGSNFYDAMLEEGKVVVVSLPPSEPVLAKTVCTAIKCLFQQTVMSRKRRFRDGELNNWDRAVFLACDEYAEIASEVPGQPVGDGRFFALARENGCMGILATQSIHMLANSSLHESWKSIFSNFGAKIFMGASDVETAREATELAGKADWQIRTPTTSHSAAGFSISTQKDLREREQIPTHVLTQMLQLGEAVVIGSLDGRASPPALRFLRVAN